MAVKQGPRSGQGDVVQADHRPRAKAPPGLVFAPHAGVVEPQSPVYGVRNNFV